MAPELQTFQSQATRPNPASATGHTTSVDADDTRSLLQRPKTNDTRFKSDVTRTFTAETYAETVNLHAKKGSESSLWPGLHFDNLARYLRRPYDHHNNHSSSEQHGARRRSSAPLQQERSPFPFASLHHLRLGTTPKVVHFIDPAELEDEGIAVRGGTPVQQLVFLRGQPTPKWLSTVGAAYRVDPELFQQHLDFFPPLGRLQYYVYPTLPSAASNILTLRYVTIGYWEERTHRDRRDVRPLYNKDLMSLRRRCSKAMRKYENQRALDLQNDFGETKLGRSMVRAFHVHDDMHFAIEQKMSICLTQAGGSWAVLVWLDTGKDLEDLPQGPWIREAADGGTHQRTSLHPIVQMKPYIALKPKSMSIAQPQPQPQQQQPSPPSQLPQSSALLHLEYGKSLDPTLMASDPFYALTEVLLLVAHSESQYLNMLEDKLRAGAVPADIRMNADSETDAAFDPPTLLYIQDILATHQERFRDHIAVIARRGGTNWPRAKDALLDDKASTEAATLQADFEYILRRIERLLALCDARVQLLLNMSMIDESKEGIHQAQHVTKLTRLAYVYIPLSFTASFFGMNLSPIISGARNSIWLWVVVSVPVALISLVAVLWDIKIVRRVVARWKRAAAWGQRNRKRRVSGV